MIRVLLQLAALQSFLLFGFFILSRPRKTENLILAGFALVVSILCFFKAVESPDFYIRFVHLIRIDWGMLLLLWPLIYLFVKYSLQQSKFNQQDLFHFIPYVINLGIMIPFFLQSAEVKIQAIDYYTPFITKGFYGYSLYYKILSITVGIQSLIYSFDIVNIVKKHQLQIKQLFSNTDKLGVTWFFVIVYGMVALSALYITSLFLNVNSYYVDVDYHDFFFLGLFILILFMSYRSFYQPALVAPVDAVSEPVEKKPKTYQQSGLSESTVVQLSAALTQLFDTERLYLNPTLTALEVCQKLNISRQHLSLILSQNFQKSFYDFVNEYRIAEFQKRLTSGNFKHLTLLGLALECGFNSKSSFNAVFKAATGMTPSAYERLQIKKST